MTDSCGIRVKSLSIHREKEILRDIDFEVAAGDTVALVGPSGIGKSSLLAVIAGLICRTGGSVTLHGEEVSVTSPPIGRCVLMPQESASLLLPWRSIKSHLSLSGMNSEDAGELADAVGLKEDFEENKKPGQLSGGEKHRLAFATVLATQAPIFLLDEPFTGLDIDVTLRCWDLLEEARYKSRNRTVLFVTHSLEEAAILADKVFHLQSVDVVPQLRSIGRSSATAWADARRLKPSDRYRDMTSNDCGEFAKELRRTVAKV